LCDQRPERAILAVKRDMDAEHLPDEFEKHPDVPGGGPFSLLLSAGGLFDASPLA
jgi:hypothetical protein